MRGERVGVYRSDASARRRLWHWLQIALPLVGIAAVIGSIWFCNWLFEEVLK